MSSEPSTLTPTSISAWKLWANPIFRRYCKSRLRPQGLCIALLISVLIAGFIFFLSRSVGSYQGHLKLSDMERSPLIGLLVFQALLLFLLGTAQVSGGMTAERDEGVIDYQRLIPMTPLAKVVGYLFGLPVREYVMFMATLPFTIWGLWRGEVAFETWAPLYAIFFTSTLTYHFTGLITGMVVRNRRWAFLVSIGIVFCLYTIVPQMAKFGLVFFKYLTLTPVFQESLPGLLPRSAGAAVEVWQKMVPSVKFFNLDLPETAFTLFCQGGLIITLLVMLCRKWRRIETHLLSKVWATGVFVWVQILFLGNALPLIDGGSLFPTARKVGDWAPKGGEAVFLSGFYGIVTLIMLFMMTKLITPSNDTQIRGWRRARKQGRNALPVQADAATGFSWVFIMAVAGAVGWFIFTRAVIESRWFPGHIVPWQQLGYFGLVMLSAGLGFHALLEAKGGRAVGLTMIFVGVVPLMFGAIMSACELASAAAWTLGMTPVSGPLYAAATLLSVSELPENISRAVPRAFYFWQGISLLVTVWLIARLRQSRKLVATQATLGTQPNK